MDAKKKLWEELVKKGPQGGRSSRFGRRIVVSFKKRRAARRKQQYSAARTSRR